jgi:hypothetical protein
MPPGKGGCDAPSVNVTPLTVTVAPLPTSKTRPNPLGGLLATLASTMVVSAPALFGVTVGVPVTQRATPSQAPVTLSMYVPAGTSTVLVPPRALVSSMAARSVQMPLPLAVVSLRRFACHELRSESTWIASLSLTEPVTLRR